MNDVLKELENLNNEILQNIKLGNYYDALGQALKLKEFVKSNFGTDNEYYINTLNHIVTCYSGLNDVENAKTYCDQLYAHLQNFGEFLSPNQFKVVRNLSNFFIQTGEYDKSESMLIELLRQVENYHGKENDDYINTLKFLGLLHNTKKEYAESEKYYFQALEIAKKIKGDVHEDVAILLHNIAVLYSFIDYSKAIPYMKKALETYRVTLGENHPEFILTQKQLKQLLDG